MRSLKRRKNNRYAEEQGNRTQGSLLFDDVIAGWEHQNHTLTDKPDSLSLQLNRSVKLTRRSKTLCVKENVYLETQISGIDNLKQQALKLDYEFASKPMGSRTLKKAEPKKKENKAENSPSQLFQLVKSPMITQLVDNRRQKPFKMRNYSRADSHSIRYSIQKLRSQLMREWDFAEKRVSRAKPSKSPQRAYFHSERAKDCTIHTKTRLMKVPLQDYLQPKIDFNITAPQTAGLRPLKKGSRENSLEILRQH